MPIRIAIADDHTLVRDALSDLIACEEGIEVVASVGDGATAVSIAEGDKPDVLLLDIALPDGSGLDLIERIGRVSPDTAVLILTMHAEPEYAAAAAARGARGLISKSAPLERLVEAVRTVAAGGSISPETELTAREREILTRIGQGEENERIADSLGLQPKTVEAYALDLMAKLGVHTRAGLVAHARRIGRVNRRN